MSDATGFEIDFLPVGSGDRSGDAIAIRYGTPGNYKVLVYDGGNQESGQLMVDHINKYYGTNHVDYVINSHPDADHASGLSVILEKMDVGELWMHQPWNYSSIILDYFRDGRITDESLAERLKNKMTAAYALEQLAEENRIPIKEPFQGAIIGNFVVLSPEKNWYVHDLIAEFQKSPAPKKSKPAYAATLGGMFEAMSKTAADAVSWVAEHWGIESLRSDVRTSAENESSVILFGQLDGKGILLTGDAGIRALHATATYVESRDFNLPSNIHFIQIPHHGSRNNVSPEVLDKIIGPRKPFDDGKTTKTAYVSASKQSSTHPRRMVVNAFIRRGVKVIATQGRSKRFPHNMPAREGWGSVTPMEFSPEVESWD